MRGPLAALLAVLVAGGGVAARVLFFTARDDAEVTAATGPGQAFEDRCARHGDPAGEARSSRPPTSGTHRPALIRRDGGPVSDDELLHALELGNVVLAYDAPRPPAALRALQEELAGPFDAEVAAAGQAVVLARRADAGGTVALAWGRAQRASGPGDPRLRAFAEHWLGRGYADARGARCPAPE